MGVYTHQDRVLWKNARRRIILPRPNHSLVQRFSGGRGLGGYRQFRSQIHDYLKRNFLGIPTKHLEKVTEIVHKTDITDEEVAFLTNFYCCMIDRYIHMLNQIDSYKWFPKQRSKINECLRKLDFLRKEDEFEIPISAIYEIDESSEVEISGAMDCLSKDGIIWEFKCVSEFKEEDILQLVVYACLYIKNFKNDRKYFLFNILSGETLEIKITQENAELFMKCIIGKKFETIDEDDPLETKISELHASIKEII